MGILIKSFSTQPSLVALARAALSKVFNPYNYYNKSEVDARVNARQPDVHLTATDKNTLMYNNAGNQVTQERDVYNGTAFGTNNTLTNYGAFAGGHSCQVGNRAAAFNSNNTASGTNAFAEGNGNTAGGECSHAGGYQSRASGKRAFAHGYQCQSAGENAIAMGTALLTQNDGEAAFGRFNSTGANIRFSVGGGSSASNRKNLLQIDADGTIYIMMDGTPVSLQDCLNLLADRIDALQGPGIK